MQCWMNGNYMAAQDLRISPFDHGFLYGLGFLKHSAHIEVRYFAGKSIWIDYSLLYLSITFI